MIKKLNIFFLFIIAPVIGFYFASNQFNPNLQAALLDAQETHLLTKKLAKETSDLQTGTTLTKQFTSEALNAATISKTTLEKQRAYLNALVANSQAQTVKSNSLLEKILSNLLGEPKYVHDGSKSTIKVYSLVEAGYRGYMAKVNIHQPDALKLVLADDKVVSTGETPSSAAKRKKGILAVNAGGYWKVNETEKAPLGITVVDGEIKTFYQNDKLSFVGFNKQGHLVGGKVNTEAELKKLDVLQGSSFTPTLLQDGKKLNIPTKWANTREPRTIVGNFSNGELLFIVIDGRKQGWSNGVTLEELQDKLLSFKIKDAFNLDGGGSSAFYYDGKLLTQPSDDYQRKVTSNLVILP